MIRQLVPFVRFDGYHVLADLVGVPNLFMHIKPTLLGLLPTRWGRADGRALKAWARAVVTLWVLIVVPLLGTLLAIMVLALPRIVGTAWDSLGLQLHALEAAWGRADMPTVAAKILSMLLLVLPVGGTFYLLVRLPRRTAKKVMRATAGRPLLRSGAALVAAMLLAGLGWIWWPGGGKYRPIGSGDHGRITDVPPLAAPPEIAPSHTIPTAVTRKVAVGAAREPALASTTGRANRSPVVFSTRRASGAYPGPPPTLDLPSPSLPPPSPGAEVPPPAPTDPPAVVPSAS